MIKQSQSLVSIIIPTYGRPAKLERAINSVLNQTYGKIEVIVVDDNNPATANRKATEKLMKQYENLAQVIYIKHEKNKNGAAARNTGFRRSEGEYICFLDDDDWFFRNKIEVQIIHLENHINDKAVYCGWEKNGEVFTQRFKGNLSHELLMMDYHPITPTIMFRREVIQQLNGFDETFKRHQDYELMLRYFRFWDISYIEDTLVGLGDNDGENMLYGIDLENLKKDFLKKFENEINILEKAQKGTRNSIYAKHFSRVFLSHLNHGYLNLALKLLFRELPKRPYIFLREVFQFSLFFLKKKVINFISRIGVL